MKFLLDMNLSPYLTTIFRENGWIIVTNDLDFGAILALEGLRFPSVIQTRRLELFPNSLFPILDRVIRQFIDELERGAIVVVDEKRMRVRLLPLS